MDGIVRYYATDHQSNHCIHLNVSVAVASSSQCDVTVTVANQEQTLANGYTYKQSLTPTISQVDPKRGGTGGGTRITVTGTGFG